MATTSELADPVTGALLSAGNWQQQHSPSAATQATITQAAAAAGVRNVCNSITACVACSTTAQTPINVYLRDGASGAGAIIWSGAIAAPANGVGIINISGLSIIGSPATAMTLEFSGAGVTGSVQTVAMSGYLAKQ